MTFLILPLHSLFLRKFCKDFCVFPSVEVLIFSFLTEISLKVTTFVVPSSVRLHRIWKHPLQCVNKSDHEVRHALSQLPPALTCEGREQTPTVFITTSSTAFITYLTYTRTDNYGIGGDSIG